MRTNFGRKNLVISYSAPLVDVPALGIVLVTPRLCETGRRDPCMPPSEVKVPVSPDDVAAESTPAIDSPSPRFPAEVDRVCGRRPVRGRF